MFEGNTRAMDRRKAAQEKEKATRPKEPKGRGRSAQTALQSDDTGISAVKEESEKLRKSTSSGGNDKCDGHSIIRKTTQKKTPKPQRTKSDPADNTDETNQLPIKPCRRRSVKDTSAKKEKCNGISPEANDKIQENTDNVKYSVTRSYSTTETESKPPMKPKKVKSLDLDTSETEEQSSNSKMIKKQQKLSRTKNRLIDDIVTEPRDVNTGRTQGRLMDVIHGKLRLKMDEISEAAKSVNKVVETLVRSEQFKTVHFLSTIEKMSTGSYYERLKISKPNEFDIMLSISQEEYTTIKLENLDKEGPFYKLYYGRRKPQAMLKYLDEEGNISATTILNEFRNLVKQVIKEQEKGMEKVSLQRKDPRSPAVTLIIENGTHNISVDLVLALQIIGNWPEETKNGMNIDDWLGTKVKTNFKRDDIFMVPKNAKTGDKALDSVTWRISFSKIEKEILTNHGNGKTCCESGGSKKEMCCRKQCLKLLKYLLELLKSTGQQRKMDQFCSYHAKTALLHHCANHPKDEDWKIVDLEICFDRYIRFFQDCLRTYNLCNFFIPSHNLFSDKFVSKSSCDYLYREIGKQMDSGYSIFFD